MYEDFKLLTDGKNAFPEIIRCIDGAKKSLKINMFIWRDDEIGNRVARAVLNAAERGVRAYISADRYGVVLEKAEEAKKSFFHKRTNLSEKLKIASLKLFYPDLKNGQKGKDEHTELYRDMLSHPNITVSADVFKADHSKYYVIDDEILILGGINIEDKENGEDMQGRAYQDYMVKLTGAEYVRAFFTKLETGKDVSEEYRFGVNCKGEYPRRFEMEQIYLDMIDGAEKQLSITMAYFSPLKKFLRAIVAAWERGVDVTLLIPARANFQNDTNRRTVKKLMKKTGNGVKVYLSPKMVHTKLIVTEKAVSFGSTNITKKAFRQLSELNLCVKNAPSEFIDELLASVRENYALSEKIGSYREITYNKAIAWIEGTLV